MYLNIWTSVHNNGPGPWECPSVKVMPALSCLLSAVEAIFSFHCFFHAISRQIPPYTAPPPTPQILQAATETYLFTNTAKYLFFKKIVQQIHMQRNKHFKVIWKGKILSNNGFLYNWKYLAYRSVHCTPRFFHNCWPFKRVNVSTS